MSFPRYPEYKNSGVAWLGDVPSTWEVVPVRALVEERTDKNSSGYEENYLSLMANVGIIPYAEKGDIGNKKPDDLSKCKKVEIGDLVINSMNYGIGSYGLSSLRGVCSSVYIVLRPIRRKIEPRYALRIFENKEFQKLAQSFGQGILAHRAAIGWDDLKNIKVPVPGAPEQAQLASFLDHETTRIDALIEEQQRLIELLKEKRQAVISHAVTKGLDPGVPMKDSGVEWLGEAPAHWDVLPLKRVVAEPLMYGANEAAEHDDPRHPRFVRITDVTEDGGLRDETFRSLPPDVAAPYLLEEGDLLLARSGATVGKSFMYRNSWGKCCFAGYLIRARVDREKAMAEFINMSLKSHGYWLYIGQQQIQATIQNVSAERYESYLVAIPPLDEQLFIVEFLNEALRKYSTLIETAQQSIDFLQERRSALISAAVTGKIDVHGWQPPPGSPTPNETTATEPA